jgi:energy-coupling factor transport system ATP-binding protein
LFLKNCTLKKVFYSIPPFSVTFKDGLNVIVGENGSGKSMFLHLITQTANTEDLKETFSVNVDPQTTFYFLDTEKHNPRIKSSFFDSKNIGFELSSRFLSHGETMLPLISAAKTFKDILLVVDEPEAGISLKNQLKLVSVFKQALTQNCQVILTTHSYILIKSVEEVFSMDSKKWIKSAEFLKNIVS